MPVHDPQELLILDVPERLIGLILDQESKVGEQLADAHAGRQVAQAGELFQELVLSRLRVCSRRRV